MVHSVCAVGLCAVECLASLRVPDLKVAFLLRNIFLSRGKTLSDGTFFSLKHLLCHVSLPCMHTHMHAHIWV